MHNERRGYKGISIPTMLEGTVHYDSIGVIQGMRHLPATFSPGTRRGPGVAETVAKLQRICDEQGLARPITEFKASAEITE